MSTKDNRLTDVVVMLALNAVSHKYKEKKYPFYIRVRQDGDCLFNI